MTSYYAAAPILEAEKVTQLSNEATGQSGLALLDWEIIATHRPILGEDELDTLINQLVSAEGMLYMLLRSIA
jgi:hypothetical protein